MTTSTPSARRSPALELAILIGLPVAVIIAGAVTTALALENGFTPIEPPAIQQGR